MKGTHDSVRKQVGRVRVKGKGKGKVELQGQVHKSRVPYKGRDMDKDKDKDNNNNMDTWTHGTMGIAEGRRRGILWGEKEKTKSGKSRET
ncbi:hypothetical protein SLS53_005934 [Cytospora paraplurivora]|uniref:Uncharacterized protein n=1 Tax=Cytospora paraplurivora TaxID=2898453 RepID=A0AAN9U4J2_9PEZI